MDKVFGGLVWSDLDDFEKSLNLVSWEWLGTLSIYSLDLPRFSHSLLYC